jgi:hypothetical protein
MICFWSANFIPKIYRSDMSVNAFVGFAEETEANGFWLFLKRIDHSMVCFDKFINL